MPDVNHDPLWFSPKLGLITQQEGIFWVIRGGLESLRHLLGTGLESNPPLPADAVRLVPAPSEQTPPESARSHELAELADKIDQEAWISARPGQLDRLEGIAIRLRQMASEQTYEWGYRRTSEPDQFMRDSTEEEARAQVEYPGWSAFRRIAPGPWETVKETSDHG